jgi:hypothetical protein
LTEKFEDIYGLETNRLFDAIQKDRSFLGVDEEPIEPASYARNLNREREKWDFNK